MINDHAPLLLTKEVFLVIILIDLSRRGSSLVWPLYKQTANGYNLISTQTWNYHLSITQVIVTGGNQIRKWRPLFYYATLVLQITYSFYIFYAKLRNTLVPNS